MIAHLKALAAVLEPLGYPVHLVWADTVTSQYVVLGGRGWDRPEEMPVCGLTDDLDTDVRVRAVTGTVAGVGTMLTRIRSLLSPNMGETVVPMGGRTVRVRYERSEFLDVDRDTTIAGTERHPAYGVDTYRLISEPT